VGRAGNDLQLLLLAREHGGGFRRSADRLHLI
jgi:hypothetical protein